MQTISNKTETFSGGRELANAQADRDLHLAKVLEVELAKGWPVGKQIELRSRIDRHMRQANSWREIAALALS